MPDTILPAGLLARPATREDAQAICDLSCIIELATVGSTESAIDDLYELWDDNAVVLKSDTLMVTTPDGTLIGYSGAVVRRGILLDPHTAVRPGYNEAEALGDYLLNFAEERARVLLAEHPELPRQIYAYCVNDNIRSLFTQRGYEIKERDYRMEINMSGPPADPQALSGITIRPFQVGEERGVYNVILEAFPDIDGEPYTRTYEDWRQGIFSASSFEPTMLYVAIANGHVVGTTICRVYPTVGDGFIWQVAVLRPWRKRGIASQLLRTAFTEYYRRGMKRIMLDVAVLNQAGALRVYERVGMHIRQISELWEKEL